MGIDAAFANTGFALAEVDLTDPKNPVVDVIDLDIVQTEVQKTPRGVPKSHDDLRRARDVQAVINDRIATWKPDFIVAEIPFGSQSARSSWTLGIALGILSAIPNLIEVTPRQVKESTGEKHADKDLMIEWAMNLHPDAPWKMRKLKGNMVQVSGSNEHMADAVGAVYAALRTEQFKRGTGIL